MVLGPEGTPYVGGLYHGKLVFPRQFPFKPPSIYMITPSGRYVLFHSKFSYYFFSVKCCIK